MAVPCGLIINELASNSLKYAFPADTHGAVNITFRHDAAQYVLRVSDTGVGLPAGFDPEKGKSLGMKLDIAGRPVGLEAQHGVGTFEIRFPGEGKFAMTRGRILVVEDESIIALTSGQLESLAMSAGHRRLRRDGCRAGGCATSRSGADGHPPAGVDGWYRGASRYDNDSDCRSSM
jgi:hypothetical protein